MATPAATLTITRSAKPTARMDARVGPACNGPPMDALTHIVPEPTAQQILATFGIMRPTAAYERRLRPDGFRLADLVEVLGDSPFLLVMDWRGVLDDFVGDALLPALAELACPLEYEPLSDAGTEGVLSVTGGGGGEIVRYLKAGDPFDPVVAACQRLVPPHIEFRADPANADSDTWTYAVLPRDDWAELERVDRTVIRHLFVPMPKP